MPKITLGRLIFNTAVVAIGFFTVLLLFSPVFYQNDLPFVAKDVATEMGGRIIVSQKSESNLLKIALRIDSDQTNLIVPVGQGLSVSTSNSDETLSLVYVSNTKPEWSVSYITSDSKGDTITKSEYNKMINEPKYFDGFIRLMLSPIIVVYSFLTISFFSLIYTHLTTSNTTHSGRLRIG